MYFNMVGDKVKPIYFSRTAIMGLLLIAQAAIQAALDGGGWPEIIQAVLGAAVIYFRGAATQFTYWNKKPAKKPDDQAELLQEIEEGLADVKQNIPRPFNGREKLPSDKDITQPGILKPKSK